MLGHLFNFLIMSPPVNELLALINSSVYDPRSLGKKIGRALFFKIFQIASSHFRGGYYPVLASTKS